MPEKSLAHHEIWDDSYLQQSWDDALEEYKKYHSIAAKGEDLDALIAETQALEQAELNALNANEDGEMYDEDEEAYEAEDVIETVLESNAVPLDGQTNSTQGGKAQAAPAPQPNGTGMPQALLATVQDENMRNLMMSWYYAGYYTGYHEGQQQALAQQPSSS